MRFKGSKGISEGTGAVLVRTSNGRAGSEGGEARDKEGACEERESTAVEEAVNMGGAGGDRRWQPMVGDEMNCDVDRTGTNISASSESTGVICRGE